ncbi:MAG: hypothetical protein M0R31_06120 [Candidatus Riflebacteria bacterium]|nr:hypothetical protein [Candidatus Riflebacteria bacterium]
MASGRVIYSNLSVSRRYNQLWEFSDDGKLAQIIYLLSYPHSDNWGHLPFDEQWIKLKVIPGTSEPIQKILLSMCILLHVKLWENIYETGGNRYTHIYNFEEKNIAAVRNRRIGLWPDESGEIPKRLKQGGKYIVIEDCIEQAQKIRSESKLYINPQTTYPIQFQNILERSGTLQKSSEDSGTFQNILSMNMNKNMNKNMNINNQPGGSGKTGSLSISFQQVINNDENSPQVIHIEGKTVRVSYLRRLFKMLNGDMEELGRILYRARKSADIHAYINSGLDEGWIYKSTIEETTHPRDVRLWIDNLFGIHNEIPSSFTGELKSINQILKETL